MLDMSWGEVMVIGAVALIVIGPKDLPKALRTVGQVVGKVRRLAAEFQGQFAEAMREAELDDVKRQIQGMNDQVSSFNPAASIRNELKSAVEAPAPASGTKSETSPAQANGHDVQPVQAEPSIDLPPVPPVDDPAQSIAASAQPKPSEPDSAPPAPAVEKPIEKAS